MQLKQSKIWLLLNIILDSHICMIQYLLSVLAELKNPPKINSNDFMEMWTRDLNDGRSSKVTSSESGGLSGIRYA